MLPKLKEIFPTLIEADLTSTVDKENHLWFTINENKLVGIPKRDITPNESLLLNTFLTPYQVNHRATTQREEQWMGVLFNHGDTSQLESANNHTFRFVYFSLSDQNVDPIAFREAIHGMYPVKVPIVWESNHEGVIIEENFPNDDEGISYNQIIDVLISDFYMNVQLYIGAYFKEAKYAPDHYLWVKKCYHTTKYYSKNTAFNYVDAVPYLILEHLDNPTISIIVESILQDTIHEEELLNTIQTFLECNSNATLAAKQLYMHRNSLQYRVDKFIERTGIDVKQFHGGLSVYLTLLLKQKLKLNL